MVNRWLCLCLCLWLWLWLLYVVVAIVLCCRCLLFVFVVAKVCPWIGHRRCYRSGGSYACDTACSSSLVARILRPWQRMEAVKVSAARQPCLVSEELCYCMAELQNFRASNDSACCEYQFSSYMFLSYPFCHLVWNLRTSVWHVLRHHIWARWICWNSDGILWNGTWEWALAWRSQSCPSLVAAHRQGLKPFDWTFSDPCKALLWLIPHGMTTFDLQSNLKSQPPQNIMYGLTLDKAKLFV